MGETEDAPGSSSLGCGDVNAIHTGGRYREKTITLIPFPSPFSQMKVLYYSLHSEFS